MNTSPGTPDLKGKPIASISEFQDLPRIRCWNCGRIIATGVLPKLGLDEKLVIQCAHKECKAFNKFVASE